MSDDKSDMIHGETLGIKWSVSQAVVESFSEDGGNAIAEIESAIHKHAEVFNNIKRKANDKSN